MHRSKVPAIALAVARCAIVASLLGLFACGSPANKTKKADPVLRDVPSILRGTIGSECTIRGVEPVLVSGFGIVVGLNGTGGGNLPVAIQATMERELARNGVGRGGILNEGPLAGKTPKQVLKDPNIAVVIVEGVIPPGSPKGARFDVRVRALPESGVTSLEGGKLWTTEMRLGPPSTFGRMRTRKIGEVEGAVFINPFADPGMAGKIITPAVDDADPVPTPKKPPATAPAPAPSPTDPDGPLPDNLPGDSASLSSPVTPAPNTPAAPLTPKAPPVLADGITRNIGQILGGGVVTEPLRLELVLDNPSHARAEMIKAAVNSRFPAGSLDDGEIARGRNDSSLAVRVPVAFKERPAEFVQLLGHLQIDQTFTAEYAKRYAEELAKQPGLADDLSWALQALGKPAVPFVLPLYDSPEFLPRMAALRAGAKLGDVRAAPRLREIAQDSTRGITFRAETIQLLGQMQGTFDPQTTVVLRRLLDAPELQIRVAAYEALLSRGDSSIERISVDEKFVVDCVTAQEEMIYVAQGGQPRIVVFGQRVRLSSPLLVSVWSNRLMIKGDDEKSAALPSLFYQDYRTGRVTRTNSPVDVRDLIKFMGHTPTPENPTPGLGLTYSEVVGAIYEIQKQGGIPGAFATEKERMIAKLASAAEATVADERPENDETEPAKPMPKANPFLSTAQPATVEAPPGSMVVPLSPIKKKPN